MYEFTKQGELFSVGDHTAEQQRTEDTFFPQGTAMQQLCDGSLRRPGEAYALYVFMLEIWGEKA